MFLSISISVAKRPKGARNNASRCGGRTVSRIWSSIKLTVVEFVSHASAHGVRVSLLTTEAVLSNEIKTTMPFVHLHTQMENKASSITVT